MRTFLSRIDDFVCSIGCQDCVGTFAKCMSDAKAPGRAVRQRAKLEQVVPWIPTCETEFSIQTGSSARKRRFSFVSRDGKGAEIGKASSVLLATELADEGVKGRRKEKAKAGYA